MGTVLITFAVLQSIVVVMHEFTHSTVAWLLGYKKNPFGIVWGNPLTMTCWDEGVAYSRLFPSGHHMAEAIIGGSPLVIHTIIVAFGIRFLQKHWTTERRWFFHTLFWFVIANLMELIAYIMMRPFASGGDTGHFNRGFGLSPWILFVGGSLLIMFGLRALYWKILPRMYAVFAKGDRLTQWSIFLTTSFLLFLWGSGIRVVFYVYPDPNWMFGLLGFLLFGIVLFACNPARHNAMIYSIPQHIELPRNK